MCPKPLPRDAYNPGADTTSTIEIKLDKEVIGCPSRFGAVYDGHAHAEQFEQWRLCTFDGVLYGMEGVEYGKALTSGEAGPWAALMPAPAGREQYDAHASNIVQLPDGTFLTAWFSGAEGQDDVAIVLSRLSPGTTIWSTPTIVSQESQRSAQNPVLFYDPATSTTYLLHTSQMANQGQGTSEVRWLNSTDNGLTWTEPQALFTESGAFTRNQMLLTKTEWLLPMCVPGPYSRVCARQEITPSTPAYPCPEVRSPPSQVLHA